MKTGMAYELEKVTAADAREMMRGLNIDCLFNDFSTRVNKVC